MNKPSVARCIVPVLLMGSILVISGCASGVTGYAKGNLIKEEITGKAEYVDEKTELTLTSKSSVKVEKIEIYGDVVINHYEKKELITSRRPALNPFSLAVYTVTRAIVAPFYLIGGLLGDGELLWHGFELLVLPIPDCSRFGPYAERRNDTGNMVCVESNSSRVVTGEYETEKKYTNYSTKRLPVTSGHVNVAITGLGHSGAADGYPPDATQQGVKAEEPDIPLAKKKAKKAKKSGTSSKTADVARQTTPERVSRQKVDSVERLIFQEDVPLQGDGSAYVDLARLSGKVPREGNVTALFRYQEHTVESRLTTADVVRAIAARKAPQLEIARKLETDGGFRGNALSGDDSGSLLVTVKNGDSEGTAWGVNLAVIGNTCPGVNYDKLVQLGDLRPGEKRTARVSVTAGIEATSCRLELTVQAREEFGQDSKRVNLSALTIKPLEQPDLYVAKISQSGMAQNDAKVELELMVANKGAGEAKGVTVTIAGLPEGVSLQQNPVRIGDLPPHSMQSVRTALRFARRFGEQVRSIPVEILVSDQRPLGKPAPKHHTIDFRFSKPVLRIADLEFYDGNDPGGLSRGNGNNLIDQGEWLLVKATIMNSGTKGAENVKVMLTSDKPANRLPIYPPDPVVIESLNPGESRMVGFKVKVPHSLEGPVGFKAMAGEEAFETLVAENRTKQIYAAAADEGTIVPQGGRPPIGTAPRGPLLAQVNIDEVESTGYRRSDAYALVIGVGAYRQGNEQLPFAASDAKIMREYLANVGGVPRENIVLLTDEEATYTGIRARLTWLAKTAGEDATVFIYFSGHGTADVKAAGKPYLLPYDGDPGALEDTAISLAELKHKINGFKTRNVLVALEACYAGGGHSVGANGAHPVALVTDDAVPTEAVILSASRANEASWDHPEQQHGIFTVALLKGMRGAAARNDGEYITADDLFEYVRQEVPVIAGKTRHAQQHPTKGGGDGRSIIVSRRAKEPPARNGSTTWEESR